MKHQTLEQLEQVAAVRVDHFDARVASQSELLERWADLLDRQPDRRLRTLRGTEFQSPKARAAMRCANSPISVAFNDPILRAAGLRDDTYGEAKRFFALSDRELHDILCYCHHGLTMSADSAARAIRRVMAKTARPSLLPRLRGMLSLIWN